MFVVVVLALMVRAAMAAAAAAEKKCHETRRRVGECRKCCLTVLRMGGFAQRDADYLS
jgi:hypothetical protein